MGGSVRGPVAGGRPEPPAWRRWAYLAGLLAVLVALVVVVAGGEVRLDRTILAFSAAIAAANLLTLRIRPGSAGTTLVILPVLAAFHQLHEAALPAVVLGSGVSAVVHHPRRAALLVAHDAIAFLFGSAVSQLAEEPWVATAAFGVTFIVVRAGLASLAERLVGGEPLADPLEPLVSGLLAPLVVVPLAIGILLGDGGILIGLAVLLAMLVIVREATNLATARREVEAERERLAEAIALHEELVDLITHDLKSPLTTVVAGSQLGRRAMERSRTEQALLQFNNIERASVSMRRLVENLGRLSRVEDANLLPSAEPVDVQLLAQEVVEELAPLAHQKRQSIHTETAPGLAAMAPPLLLHEAMNNLVSNAIKYTPEGGQITIRSQPAASSEFLELSIADTGIGIAEADQARLFTRFFRSTDPRASAQRGAGLGLALTKRMIERMGGQIRVQSALNQGTTFVIELPAATADESAA